MKYFIFDVDGVLCNSGERIKEVWYSLFHVMYENQRQDLAKFMIVTGSPWEKIKPQIGDLDFDYKFCCSGNEVYNKQNELVYFYDVEWVKDKLENWFQRQLQYSKFPQDQRYLGQIEYRRGSINFSILGRWQPGEHKGSPDIPLIKSQRQKYIDWDNTYHERDALIKTFNFQFGLDFNYVATKGGQTGIDITHKDHNKAQVLNWIGRLEHTFFFADALDENGNDYPLAQALHERHPFSTTFHIKNGPTQTRNILTMLNLDEGRKTWELNLKETLR